MWSATLASVIVGLFFAVAMIGTVFHEADIWWFRRYASAAFMAFLSFVFLYSAMVTFMASVGYKFED